MCTVPMPGKALCKRQNMTRKSSPFLSEFAKLQKAVVSIVMSCLSGHRHGTILLKMVGFS